MYWKSHRNVRQYAQDASCNCIVLNPSLHAVDDRLPSQKLQEHMVLDGC